MFSFLYQIIIIPITTLLEVFYLFFNKVLDNPGLSIIGLSFVITICTLPLYLIAEKWQEEERKIQEILKPRIERIKNAFKGDEQYMILSTFYKQNHYHPIMALRSSFSLLIQIPFFIAAYNFISNLTVLRGHSFLFIKNFGAPDALFSIGSFTINILPIAMTIINCISGIIYSKGHPIQEKIQIFLCAGVFLVLLYDSPAALVLYWTMNNILSLVKNIFLKLKNPKKAAYIVMCFCCLFGLLAGIFVLKNTKMIFRIAFISISVIFPILPFVIKYFSKLIINNFKLLDSNKKLTTSIFISSGLILTVLAGLYIPSMLVVSETSQFCYVDSYKSPFYFIFNTFFQAFGFFIFWPACFYFLFSNNVKKIMTVLYPVIAISAIVNSIIFSGNYGPLQKDLLFMIPQRFWPSLSQLIINSLVLLAILVICLSVISKKPLFVRTINMIILFTFSVVFAVNFTSINKTYKNLPIPNTENKVDPIYHLSKTKQNVILIMQDRLFTPYVDCAFTENEELRKNFSGFTFYKNCISFGPFTMIGTPCLYGGYDFTPFEINKRIDQTLQEKHNQALLTLPVLFLEKGWNVTVSDLAYENYLEYPVTDMYKDYPQINRKNVLGAYSDLWCKRNNVTKSPYYSSAIKRNFIWFSFFKMVPPVLRTGVYGRDYWVISNQYENLNSLIDNYAPLDLLTELVDFTSNESSFIIIENELTHDGAILQAPDFIPSENVNNSEYKSIYKNNADYHTQISALKRISDLISYLKENNVYDNTKIIIVSDHGIPAKLPGYFENSNNLPFSPSRKTACLLVKDFNSNFEFSENMDFMTNADTPYLTTYNIIPNAINPFTGNPLKVDNKNDYIKISIANAESTRIRNNTTFKIADDEWATVKENIYIDSNWSMYKK